MSRLYRVLVSFEYVALADSAAAAEVLVDDVLANEDASEEMTVRAVMLRNRDDDYPLPDGYDEQSAVYGDPHGRTLEQLIAEERVALEMAAFRRSR
jgi:hypothetical protein